MEICGTANTLDDKSNMYIQFLVEDASTGKLISRLMDKVKNIKNDDSFCYNIKSFKGIGTVGKCGKSIIERKTGKLLNDLPNYLKGFNKSLSSYGNQAAIVVILDNDKRDTDDFRRELEKIVTNNKITMDHIFGIAVKEMEAWLLGDRNAIANAYPDAKLQLLSKYEQDGICDTWEILADIVYPKGSSALMKKADGSYYLIGLQKSEWADKIGYYMDFKKNNSPSFQYFVEEINKRYCFLKQ